MGKSVKTIVGHRTLMGLQMLLGFGPIDRITALYYGGKQAWAGSGRGGRIVVDAEELHGGERSGGGISGWIDIEMGAADQGVNAYLSTHLGAPLSAFRGLCTLVARQLYWGTSTYLQELTCDPQRVLIGHDGAEIWRADLAPIHGEFQCHDTALYIAMDLAYDTTPALADEIRAAAVRLLTEIRDQAQEDRPNDICIVTGVVNSRESITLRDCAEEDYDTLIAWVEARPDPPGDMSNWQQMFSELSAFFNGGAAEHPFAGGGASFGSTGRLAFDPGDGACSRHKRRIAIGLSTGEPYQFGETAAAALIDECGQLDVHFCSWSGDGFEMVDAVHNLPEHAPGENLEGDAESAWTAISRPFRGVDLNPVHVLREALISRAWGRGEPVPDFHPTMWDAAAQTCFDEGFGLSIFWERQEAVEELISQVLGTVGAVVGTDRSSGLWRITLLRDDLDEEALPVLTEDEISAWESVTRRDPTEAPTAITVRYSDRLSRAQGARTAIDNAAALRLDEVETLDFPFITSGAVAARVAERELAARAAPLLSGAIQTSRLAAQLHEGDGLIIDAPRRGIHRAICRVTEITAGDAEDHAIRITFSEVEHRLPASASILGTAPPRGPVGVSTAPRPAAPRLVEEAPYHALARLLGDDVAAERLAADDGFGLLRVAAGAPHGGAIEAQIAVDAGGGYEILGSTSFSPAASLLEDLDRTADATSLRVSASSALRRVPTGSLAVIGEELVRIDAIAEAETEALGAHALLTLGRGCLDTAPAAHVEGARILFLVGAEATDGVVRTAGEALDVRLLTRTGSSALALGAAPVDSAAFDFRALRPLPPGRVQVDGAYLDGAPVDPEGVLTWAHRDRLMQTGPNVDDHTAGDIGPEAGVTYRLDLTALDAGGASLGALSSLPVASPFALGAIDYAGAPALTASIEATLYAVRDEIDSRIGFAFGWPIDAGTAGSAVFIQRIGVSADTALGTTVTLAALDQLDGGPAVTYSYSVTASTAGAYLLLGAFGSASTGRTSIYLRTGDGATRATTRLVSLTNRSAIPAAYNRRWPFAVTVDMDAGESAWMDAGLQTYSTSGILAGSTSLSLVRPGALIADRRGLGAHALTGALEEMALDGGAISIPTDGWYLVAANAGYDASAEGRNTVAAAVDGVERARHSVWIADALTDAGSSGAWLLDLDAGDSLSLLGQGVSGDSVAADERALSAWRIRSEDMLGAWELASDHATIDGDEYIEFPTLLTGDAGGVMALTGRFVAPADGWYILAAHMDLDSTPAASGAYFDLFLENDTAGTAAIAAYDSDAPSGERWGISIAQPLYASTGDVFRLRYYAPAVAGTHTIKAGARFSLVQLSV